MRTNTQAIHTERAFEGGLARSPRGVEQLLRQTATCLLFEDTFYASGSTIANEIAATAATCSPVVIAEVATLAREDFKLRHVPLWLLVQLNKQRATAPLGLIATTIERVIQRPDEMGEFLALLAKDGKAPVKKVLTAQVKKGLARAFRKFSAYQLAKWNRDAEIKLRDVMFLVHPKPRDAEQAHDWACLVDGVMAPADTWEVALSAGADKKDTWERLLREDKLGYIALLMNLRNMVEARVNPALVEKALISKSRGSRALPFRFVSAAKYAPSFAQAVSDAMVAALEGEDKLAGTTYLVLDVSGSMDAPLSNKGELTRLEAGAALGVLLREVCEHARVFTFSNSLIEVHNLRGLALMKGISQSQMHGGTALAESLRRLYQSAPTPDRIIVVTDEQTSDGITSLPAGVKGYLVNVAPYAPGLETGARWTRINGFSERVVDFVRWHEANPT